MITPDTEFIASINQKFSRMLDRQREIDATAQAVAEALECLPRPKCRFHPGQDLELDAPRTAREWQDRTQDPTPRWKRCPRCEHEASVLLPRWQFWRSQGVPRAYFSVTLDELEIDERIKAQLERYAAAPEPGFLVLLGPPGQGKSHAALSVLQQQRRGRYMTQEDLLAGHRERYGNRQAEDVRTAAMTTPFLVIDELGRAGGGNDATQLWTSVFDSRYRDGRPTVICSNFAREELRPRLGDHVVDRINGGLVALLEFAGRSSRGTARDRWAERVALVDRLERLEEKLSGGGL